MSTQPEEPEDTFHTKELINRYRTGETVAERDLFERHRELLLDQAKRHRLMRRALAFTSPEDLVDEVFLRALSSGLFDTFEHRGTGSLKRALFTILERTIVDVYRRHGAVKRAGIRADLAPDATGAPGAASKEPTPTSQARTDEILQLCRDQMDEREWEVWRLTEVEGQTPREIGMRLGHTDSAIRSVLHRARKKLLSALASRLDGDE